MFHMIEIFYNHVVSVQILAYQKLCLLIEKDRSYLGNNFGNLKNCEND
ncbi:unnamed protein product [Paramecium octaurelia]|uniref:Uncharacterized protein n=1 Tax=Paramecium octaurelia TaxID=43137 RepID=A0A8S1X1C4_PAROT|nr:unnamed protein product [Paramecium octaurelia]